MTAILILICLLLITIVVVQIGKVTELASSIRGEEDAQFDSNKWNGLLSVAFMVLFLVGCVVSAVYYKNYMLGYGPHISASEHGSSIDFLFDLTLFFTGIVFIITHIALFWFAYKYRGRKGHKADFISHNDRLEIVWTLVPAVVMTLLVVGGLDAWNDIMFDVDPDEEHIEIEATGVQFNWLLRYPGPDGAIGTRDYKLITGTNPMGQDWTDPKNHDDFHPSEIVLPVGKKVRVRIIGRDVLHNFYLPHFRVKMDAVPGIPTYFVFTPTVTTEEYRQRLSEYPEYQVPADPTEPDGPQRWETFEYELACAELCGSGHFSMRRILRVVSEEEYQDWLAQQSSYYLSTIRNSDDDPLKGKLLELEISGRKVEFSASLNETLAKEEVSAEAIALKHLFFETASAVIMDDSRFELENLADALKANSTLRISIEGHTDNVGEEAVNLTLSKSRADAVLAYLIEQGIDGSRLSSVGYGSSKPVAENDSDANRTLNRRTEFRILSK